MDSNQELFDEVSGKHKREVINFDGPKCKLCGAHEQKDAAGHSNISYTYNICIDCLMNWR